MLGSDDHADQAKTLIASLNREIAQLQQYDPVEFTTVDQAARTENQLIDLVRSGDFEVVDLDAIPEPEPIPWEQPTFLYLTWDPNGGGEEGRMLEMYVTGYLDAGGALTGPDADGFLWAEDGTKAAQLFSLPETDGALVLEIYEPDGVYDIEISNGYEWATANLLIWTANPVIEFQPMGGERVVLADVGNEYYGDYYWRAPTGIHLFTFSIDHEEIKPLYW